MTARVSQIGSQYEVIQKLGEGAWGETFLTRDLQADRLVVVKRLRFQYPDRLAQIKALQSPGVAAVLDWRYTDTEAYQVTEYLQGQSLRQMMSGVTQMPFTLVAALGIELCQILGNLHQQGMCHGNLKPSNIMVIREGGLKLLDLQPQLISVSHSESELSAVSLECLQYAAPEQWQKATSFTPNMDVYALGLSLYEALIGSHPFDAPKKEDFIHNLLHAELPEICDIYWDVPEALSDILKKAMSRDPEQRYASVDAFAEALRTIVDERKIKRVLNAAFEQVQTSHSNAKSAKTLDAHRPIASLSSTQTDVRLFPDVKVLLEKFHQDLVWLPAMCASLPMREFHRLSKVELLERLMGNTFSGLVQINDNIWALVQQGYFLDFFMPGLPQAQEEHIFQLLPDTLTKVCLYTTSEKKLYLPLLLSNLVDAGGESSVGQAELGNLSAWTAPEAPAFTGSLICKMQDQICCLGYLEGKQVYSFVLNGDGVLPIEISLDRIMAQTHILWDFYQVSLRLSQFNDQLLLRYTEAECLPGQTRGKDIQYHFQLHKGDIQILNTRIAAQELVSASLLSRCVDFIRHDFAESIDELGQDTRFSPVLGLIESVRSWQFYYQAMGLRDERSLDVAFFDQEKHLKGAILQIEGDVASLKVALGYLETLQMQGHLKGIGAIFLLTQSAYAIAALAAYGRLVKPLAQQWGAIPGVLAHHQQDNYLQVCLLEYHTDTQSFKLVAPSLWG